MTDSPQFSFGCCLAVTCTEQDVGEDMDAVYEDPGEALQAAPVTMSPSSGKSCQLPTRLLTRLKYAALVLYKNPSCVEGLF